MGFQEVQDLSCDTTTALGGINKKTNKPNPTKVEGYFLGTKAVEVNGKPAKIHVFQTSKGTVGVWGKTDLDRKMTTITAGTMTRATHTGMLKVPGKNDMYKYKVEQDKDDAVSVEATSSSITSQASEPDYAEGNDSYEPLEETALDEEESFEEPAPKPAFKRASVSSAPDAARTARVQALLSSNRK